MSHFTQFPYSDERPHWQVLHDIFAGDGPATFEDVLTGYGMNFINRNAKILLSDNTLNPEIDTMAKAEVRAWVHLRGVIDAQRKRRADQAAREAAYDGDREANTPLNPFYNRRSPELGPRPDYPKEFNGSARDRQNYDDIGR